MIIRVALAALAPLILLSAAGGATAGERSRCPHAPLGVVAYIRGEALHVLDVRTCRDRVLARGVRPPVRFSGDGRYVASGDGAVVAVGGGRTTYPLGRVAAFAWRPGTSALVGVTRGGGVLVGGPGRPRRQILRGGQGAGGLVFDPSGASLAIGRSRGADRQEIVTVAWPSLAVQEALSRRGFGSVTPAALARGGGWLFFWTNTQRSASIAADGLPLAVKGVALGTVGPTIVPRMLLYPDFVGWCGRSLLAVAGGDRYATHGKRILGAAPPLPARGQLWRVRDVSRDRTRSWVSPACSPNGRWIASAAGPNGIERRFGEERRSVWLLARDGSQRRRLTRPGSATDELPRWSADGRYLLFVRSRGTRRPATALGTLHLVDTRTGSTFGPVAKVGPIGNYYGHYGWAEVTDWFRR